MLRAGVDDRHIDAEPLRAQFDINVNAAFFSIREPVHVFQRGAPVSTNERLNVIAQ